jgi:hypothetical protein
MEPAMSLEPLVLDLIEWIAKEPRTYAEVMEAWRTSCPKLAVWEEAIDRGFVERPAAGRGSSDETWRRLLGGQPSRPRLMGSAD